MEPDNTRELGNLLVTLSLPITHDQMGKLVALESQLDDLEKKEVSENAYFILSFNKAVKDLETAKAAGNLKPQDLQNLKERVKALDALRLLAEMKISDVCRKLRAENPFI